MENKGNKIVVDGDDIRFVVGIGGGVAIDICCARVAIK